MSVAVTFESTPGPLPDETLASVVADGPPAMKYEALVTDVTLAAGVHGRIDLAKPSQWVVIWVDELTDEARPVLVAMIGAEAAEQLESKLKSGAEVEFPIQLSAAEDPWLRVAAVEALDRWLHLPLNQSLVDAERAAVRGSAALRLGRGPAREELVGEALQLARKVAFGVVDYLHWLTPHAHTVPDSLGDSVGRLVEGYRVLAAEVAERDADLQSVVTAGNRLLHRRTTGLRMVGMPLLDRPRPGATASGDQDEPADRAPSLIDPRQVPARVLDLSPESEQGEVTVVPCMLGRVPAVQIDVPVYTPLAAAIRESEVRDTLLVRLLDSRTGRMSATGLLNLEQDPAEVAEGPVRWVFRGVVPVRDLDPETLRADVFAADIDVPSAPNDSDPDLLAVRQDSTLLAQWRRLSAIVRVAGEDDEVLRAAAELAGEPAESVKELLAETPSRQPVGRVTVAGAAMRARTTGAGALLVAELAAAHMAALVARS